MVEINETAVTVVEGESITLYCNATGKPDPTLTWTKVDNPRPLSNNTVLKTGILNRTDTINNMIQYQCTASNGVESPATAIANISVYCKYEVHSLKLSMTGSNVLFYCVRPKYGEHLCLSVSTNSGFLRHSRTAILKKVTFYK